MFFVLSRAWDKEKILSLHEESNLKPSNTALGCSTTVPQRLHGERGLLRTFSHSIYKHDAIGITDPSSMQDACHMNSTISTSELIPKHHFICIDLLCLCFSHLAYLRHAKGGGTCIAHKRNRAWKFQYTNTSLGEYCENGKYLLLWLKETLNRWNYSCTVFTLPKAPRLFSCETTK